MRQWEELSRPGPLAAQGGIKSQSNQGDFGKSWWAKRWQDVLEGFRIGGRLARGRTYARTGQVLSIDVAPGEVKSRVQGSRPEPYDVTIEVKELRESEWSKVIEALSRQALLVAKLFAGEMPQDVEAAFVQSRVSLFPHKRGDLRTSCSCPDESNPCKHIAAVYYLLGEEFDRDPFLIFRLRGLERNALLARLSSNGKSTPQRKPQPDLPPVVEPLSVDPGAFWTLEPLPDDFFGEVQSPPLSAGVVRRLGKFPFWRGERPLVDAVEPTYIQAAAQGISTYLGEHDAEAK